MTRIFKDGYEFEVDRETTLQYYETQTLCKCGYCRNYYAQINEKFPELKKWLAEFGVSADRPDELTHYPEAKSVRYLSADYTVAGKVAAAGERALALSGGASLRIMVTEGFVSPNRQTGAYFTLSVCDIELPWVLDEPLSTPAAASRRGGFPRRMLRKKH